MGNVEPVSLAVAIHRNDTDAPTILVQTFQDALYTYAFGILRNAFDAQEVTQDALIRAIERFRHRYDEEKCRGIVLKPWLFRVTRNLALNRLRSRRRNKEDPVETEAVATGTDVLADLVHDEKIETLYTAMGHLDTHSRELLLLRFVEEMSYAEFSAIQDVADAAARGTVFRAVRRLKTVLNRMERDHEL